VSNLAGADIESKKESYLFWAADKCQDVYLISTFCCCELQRLRTWRVNTKIQHKFYLNTL